MPQLSISQKAVRTGILLCGLRDRRIAAYLARFGLTEADLQEGWELYLRAIHLADHEVPLTLEDNPERVRQLELFASRWFPVADLSLREHSPELAHHLFLHLDPGDQQHIAWTVAYFLQRLRAMAEGAKPFGPAGRVAWSLLGRQGLGFPELQAGERMLEQLQSLTPMAELEAGGGRARLAAAEEMWKWYSAWSRLALEVIDDESLLRVLGFHKPRAGDAVLPEDDEDLTSPPAGTTPPPLAG